MERASWFVYSLDCDIFIVECEDTGSQDGNTCNVIKTRADLFNKILTEENSDIFGGNT